MNKDRLNKVFVQCYSFTYEFVDKFTGSTSTRLNLLLVKIAFVQLSKCEFVICLDGICSNEHFV